jgi:hypothetical protein
MTLLNGLFLAAGWCLGVLSGMVIERVSANVEARKQAMKDAVEQMKLALEDAKLQRCGKLLARLVEYVNTVEEALMQTEVGRNAWPRYAERLREAGEALKRECANAKVRVSE